MFWGKDQILFECFVHKYDKYRMFDVENQYLPNPLGRNQILFTCLESTTDTLRKFLVKIWNFSSMLRKNPIPFNCFAQMFCAKTRIWSNVFRKSRKHFKCFGWQICQFHAFKYFWKKIKCISNILRTNTIISNVLRKHSKCLRMFWCQMMFFSNILGRNWILSECTAKNNYISNISSRVFILFECFAQKYNNFWMSCVQTLYLLNVLWKKSILFFVLDRNQIL